jgi:AcrR family transcriptional regulator
MSIEPMPKISKKQQQIVATAEELFFRHGMKRVTVEEICQKANVSKMTFYKYFPNKIELVKHLTHLMLERGEKKLNEVEAMPLPFTEKLRLMQEYKLELTAKMCPEFIEEFMYMGFSGSLRKEWIQRVMRFLTDAQQRGDIRSEIRPEFILVVIDKLNELVDDERLKNLYPNYVEFTREIWDFFYYGIVNRGRD